MREVVFFSHNINKIKEVKSCFRYSKIKILTLNDYPGVLEPKETGNTFKKNASIKSIFGYKYFKKPCFADDSGICIEALNYLPGVRSKRYLLKNGNIENSLRKIISIAKLKKKYNAFFKSTIAFTSKSGSVVFFEGKIKGTISLKIKGPLSFAYDPIFVPLENKKTFAQMRPSEKNKISHRGMALQKLKEFLLKTL